MVAVAAVLAAVVSPGGSGIGRWRIHSGTTPSACRSAPPPEQKRTVAAMEVKMVLELQRTAQYAAAAAAAAVAAAAAALAVAENELAAELVGQVQTVAAEAHAPSE